MRQCRTFIDFALFIHSAQYGLRSMPDGICNPVRNVLWHIECSHFAQNVSDGVTNPVALRPFAHPIRLGLGTLLKLFRILSNKRLCQTFLATTSVSTMVQAQRIDMLHVELFLAHHLIFQKASLLAHEYKLLLRHRSYVL